MGNWVERGEIERIEKIDYSSKLKFHGMRTPINSSSYGIIPSWNLGMVNFGTKKAPEGALST